MAERREQLLDAALTIIDRDGYDGVSIDAIAREIGVTRPVVYGAFDGLGPLLSALLDRQQRRALDQLYGALPLTALGRTPAEIVELGVPALHTMLLADPVNWRIILSSPASGPDVVRERVDSDRRQVLATVETMIGAVLPPGADTEVLAHAVLALLEHFARLVLDDPERFTAERLATTARDMLAAWLP